MSIPQNQTALMVRDDANRAVSFTTEANQLKEAALELSALVGRVTNADENSAAVLAQVEIQKIRSLAEKARKAAKEPVLEYGKAIDNAAKQFLAELDEENLRISKLIGDFQALEAAKLRAAERLRQEELNRIEREKNEALAKAKNHEELESTHAHFNEVAAQSAAAQPIAAPVRAEGQVVKTDWEIIVTNPYDLAKFHPSCVNITPRLSEIKQLLAEGVTVKGITANKITKAGVRLGAPRQPIEV